MAAPVPLDWTGSTSGRCVERMRFHRLAAVALLDLDAYRLAAQPLGRHQGGAGSIASTFSRLLGLSCSFLYR
jgi:hypothetical protein